jgi:hypothetical protein
VGLSFVSIFGFSKLFLSATGVLLVFHWIGIQKIQGEIGGRLTVDIRAIVSRGLLWLMLPLLIMLSFVYYTNPDVQESAVRNQLPPSITKPVADAAQRVVEYQLGELSTAQRNQVIQEITQRVLGQLNSFARPYFKYFPPILAFGLFLVLQGLSFVFLPMACYVAWGMFKFMLKVGFVRIEVKDVKAESLCV